MAVVIELTRGWSCAQNQRLEEHVPSSIHREHENWNFKKRVIHAYVSITSITMDFCSIHSFSLKLSSKKNNNENVNGHINNILRNNWKTCHFRNI